MDPRTSPITASLYDILSLPLLDDEDFESTMTMLDNAAFRREDPDSLDLNLTGLSDAFNSHDTGSPLASSALQSMNAGGSGDVNSLSPDLKIRITGRTPVSADVYIKQESNMPDFSPVMDSFLRESWDDIVGPGSRSGRPSFKPTTPLTISATPGRVNPLPDTADSLQYFNFVDFVICFVY
ncbi:Hypothetical protein PHPALM_17744 [Phytophthora palmivora]|uniref:Uncharacterized protein n=1 Tax=Phytophthora palmivora TaxID=4796 RepID=A0A2P4XLF6_9STRA|nr:Hypothetical protein PHPALM_17744 [Phytophthora palmivora]